MPLITGKQIADGSITNSKLSGKFSAQTPRVVRDDLVTAPGSTTVGDIYILAGIGGTWSGGAIDDLAEALDATGTLWNFVTPAEGFVAWVLAPGGSADPADYRFLGGTWELESFINSAASSVVLGRDASNFPASNLAGATGNVILGDSSVQALNTGNSNVILGKSAANALTDGNSNIIIGALAGAALTTGDANVLIAPSASIPTAATTGFMNLGELIYGDITGRGVRIGGAGTNALSSGVSLELESTAPLLRMFETGADADEKNYDIKTSGGDLVIETIADDLGVGQDILVVSRTGTVLDTISLGDDTPEFIFRHNQADHTEAMLLVENGGTDGAAFQVFTGDISPIGVVTGSPGDLYVQSRAGVASTTYQHKGASANNTDWFIIGPSLIQTDFTDLAVNTTTTAVSFVSPSTLLTTTITKLFAGSKIIVHFSVGTSNTNNGRQMFFRVVVDGVAQRAVAVDCTNSGIAQSASIVTSVIGVAVGSRTILIEWYTSANTGQVRPVAAPDSEHASMLVEEVLA